MVQCANWRQALGITLQGLACIIHEQYAADQLHIFVDCVQFPGTMV
jgi:hypothetical protein